MEEVSVADVGALDAAVVEAFTDEEGAGFGVHAGDKGLFEGWRTGLVGFREMRTGDFQSGVVGKRIEEQRLDTEIGRWGLGRWYVAGVTSLENSG